jgi:aspartate aminotransferase-like enzyme
MSPRQPGRLSKTRLLTPGPTAVPEAVLLEMAQPIIHHRTRAFEQIFTELSQRLQRVFRTNQPVVTIAGSGTTAFEAAQVSLIEPGTAALTIAGGKFGERWQDICDAYGVAQQRINVVALGQRAVARLKRVPPAHCYNLDLRKWLASWRKATVPFTPPVSLIRGQRMALQIIEEQGLENVWQHTAQLAAAVRAALLAMGLKLISQAPSDSVSGAYYPEGIDDSAFRAALRDRHGIHIAGGQNGRGGKWQGKIFRISHMGYVDAGDTLAALGAIEAELIAAGVKIEPGTAVAAASAGLV